MTRSFWLALAALAYACSVMASATHAGPAGLAALVPAALALGLAWRWGEPSDEPDRKVARSAFRTAMLGAEIALFGLASPFDPTSRALVAVGVGLASTAGVVAIASAPGMPGLSERLARPPRGLAAILTALAWTVALAVPLARVATPERAALLDPTLDARLASIAAMGSLGVLAVSGAQASAARRLELGASDRLRTFLGLATTLFAATVLGSALRLARTETLLP
ncbi:MAG TPA: hypothetical protein VL400_17170, partial [Polyangiaceae bacterium]|nr:hypothetical protein [Polyangiaceae bacterium]